MWITSGFVIELIIEQNREENMVVIIYLAGKAKKMDFVTE